MPESTRAHRGDRGSPWLLVAVVCVLLLVVTGVMRQTGASWTTDADVDAGPITSGRLDLTVAADSGPDGKAVQAAGLAVSDLLPGDSRAVLLTVRNASGEAPLAFTLHGRASNTALGDALGVRVWVDATSRTSGSSATGWTGSCDGGTALGGDTVLGSTDTALSASTVGPLAPGATRRLCVRVSVPTDAPTSAQGVSGRVVLTVGATSVRR